MIVNYISHWWVFWINGVSRVLVHVVPHRGKGQLAGLPHDVLVSEHSLKVKVMLLASIVM